VEAQRRGKSQKRRGGESFPRALLFTGQKRGLEEKAVKDRRLSGPPGKKEPNRPVNIAKGNGRAVKRVTRGKGDEKEAKNLLRIRKEGYAFQFTETKGQNPRNRRGAPGNQN